MDKVNGTKEVNIEEVRKAYVWMRQNNQSIPDEILDLMKDAAIEKIRQWQQSQQPEIGNNDSDAVEFAEWRDKQFGEEPCTRNKELYTRFKQSKL